MTKHWTQFLPEAEKRLERSKAQLGPYGHLFRAEAATPPESKAPAVDPAQLVNSDPTIAAYVQAQIRAALDTASREAEASTAGLVKNRNELLEEKRVLAEQLQQIQADLTTFRKEKEQKELKDKGHDPEEFERAVNAAADTKFRSREQELATVQAKLRETVSTQEARLKELEEEAHYNWVYSQLIEAQLPAELRQLIPGNATQHFVKQVSKMVVPVEVPGIGKVARIKVNGTWLAPPLGADYATPDSIMDPKGFFAAIRQGTDPALKDLQYFLVSPGQGSGKADTSNHSTSGIPWEKMTLEQRNEFVMTQGGAKGALQVLATKR